MRVPDVLVHAKSTPDLGQEYLRAGIEHAVADPARADAGRGIVDLHAGGDVGAVARSPHRIAGIGANCVAAGKIELAAHRSRPADAIGGMAVVDVVGSEVVGAARFVGGSAGADETPGLIDAQVGDDVGD